ncbi:probable serine/threonine-protein kinase nek3 isoform X2 [Episyrphus balteatus]|uniref:probable serine/threonine-protein kinase nek3 isoform X2 n=1 Tax=Episyrphus balteatus TaxID=286459 RepID=UPI002485E1EF|nr:probable serine/threonine-protein kinase nek3 isoform X2 [Episyrphus balteatus]
MASPGSDSSSSLTTLDSTIPDIKTSPKSQIVAASCSLRKEHTSSLVFDNETSVFRSLTSPNNHHQMDTTTPSPPNVGFDIPQWKKDLIQRRKINIAKTIAAASGSCSKEDIVNNVTGTTETLETLSPNCDLKNSHILSNNNNNDKVLLHSPRINTIDDTNKCNTTSQNSITSSATTSIDNVVKTPATLQLQQTQVKIELLRGGHYTQVNNKSSSLHNYNEKLSERSVSTVQPEHQQPPIPLPRSVVVGSIPIEQKSNDGSSSTLPQENVRFRKNLTEQRESTTNTTSSDSLLTPISRSSVKVAAAAEMYKKSNKDTNSSITVCVSEEHHSHVFQQEPDLTTTNINKGNKNDNGDDEHDEDDYDEHQLHHQLISERESDNSVCAGNLNETEVKEIASDSISTKNSNKINIYNNSSLKSAVVNNKKPCGIANASVRSGTTSASVSFKKNQNIGNANEVSTHHNYKINAKLRSNQNSSLTPSPSIASTTAANNESSTRVTNNKKKMVAVQEMNDITNNELDFDPSEELQYGPGIVSKLRCRYLSLALRQSIGKQRLPLDSLRRATSLNNLLDGNGVHEDEDEEDETPDTTNKERTSPSLHGSSQIGIRGTSTLAKVNEGVIECKENTKMDSYEKMTGPMRLSYNNQHRSRHIKRGNDSLKRARSVEALLCEKSPWNFSNSQQTTINNGATDSVTIEDKINNARERLLSGTDNSPPKRLTSIIDDTERPPPDLVKQTLKIFEASANRRGGTVIRNSGGEVATKVANYKSIITQNKPSISFAKPALNPKTSHQKFKPSTLTEVKNNINNSSPISPTIASSSSSVQQSEKIVSPTISTPTTSGQSNTSKYFRPKMDSTSIRNFGCVSSVVEGLSENSPDIIPRHNLIDKTVMSVDSPVTDLTKSIEKLRIESPTTTTQVERQQQPSQKESRFSSESSEAESGDDDDDSMDGEYVVNNEESNSTKEISKSALESIAKAGTSQQFIFQKNTSVSFSKGNYLASEPLHDIPSLATAGSTTTTTVKQIGVIRPLLAEYPQKQIKNNCSEEMSNNQSPSALTSREIEKNRINNEKKIKTSESNNLMDNKKSLNTVTSKLKKIEVSGSEDVTSSQAPAILISKKKRAGAGNVPENNTMVFNFKDRKEVPDYIENDGLIFKHKRELPKVSNVFPYLYFYISRYKLD